MTSLQALERLDALRDEAYIRIGNAGGEWAIYFHDQYEGGLIFKVADDSLESAVKQAVNKWESR